MGELRGLSALEAWSKRVTQAYKNVSVHNLTTSWRDGLAFCAVIHHYRPDLIHNPDSMSKDNILENNQLAFKIAEDKLGITPLLEPEDMVKHEEPDRFSIATYLSEFYNVFERTRRNSSGEVASKQTVAAPESSTSSRAPGLEQMVAASHQQEPTGANAVSSLLYEILSLEINCITHVYF